jgi:4-amino-4-deoxy-L-arabinose transferase-like glycosyltransferase
VAATGVFFLVLIGLLFSHALARPLARDEEQFVSAGALLLRDGFLPYRHYPFFHMPNLALIFAGLFWTNDFLLLTARCFNATAAALLLILLFVTVTRRFRAQDRHPLLMAAACVLIFYLNPFFQFTSGRAWNHDLPMLATVGAFVVMIHGLQAKRGPRWLLCSGALLGLAIGTRLSFAPLFAGFVLALIAIAPAGVSPKQAVGLFSAGLVVALLPTIALALSAPHEFYFDNFTYNGPLNRAYRESALQEKSGNLYKTLFILQQLKQSRATLALLGGAIYFAAKAWRHGGWKNRRAQPEIVALCCLLPFVLVGVLAPTPPYPQYLFAVIPFLFMINIYGLTDGTISRRHVAIFVSAVVLLAVVESGSSTLRESLSPSAGRWPAVALHHRAKRIHHFVQKGPVLTLDPIYPLEARIGIYKELATGPFAWRTAAFLDKDKRKRFKIVGPDELEDLVQPAAVLIRLKPNGGEEALVTFVQTHGYSSHRLGPELMLWLPPNSSPAPHE